MKRAIYPGSFDPMTLGHMDIIERASKLFDELIIGVLNNSSKNHIFNADERMEMAKLVTEKYDNVKVKFFDGLLVDFARQEEAPIIVRGLRAVTDFEYELQMAQTNHVQYDKLETVFLTTAVQYSYLSSTIVREFAKCGSDISKFVDPRLIDYIHDKYKAEKQRRVF